MNWARFTIATLAAVVVQMIVGTIWHVALFKELYAEQMAMVARPEPLMGAMVLAVVARGLLFAWIYPVGYKGGAPLREGVRFGVMMGLLSGVTAAIFFGTTQIGAGWFWADFVYFVIEGALAGIAIAFSYGAAAGHRT